MNVDTPVEPADRRDFFISYTASDVAWARWIAWELSRSGFTYAMQEEDIPPGSRFMTEMQRWLQSAHRVLAVLSPEYFLSPYALLEMRSAVVSDPTGEARQVIPVRVSPCDLPRLFNDLVYIDFVGKSQVEQRRALVAGVRASMVGSDAVRTVKERPDWPGTVGQEKQTREEAQRLTRADDLPLRVQYFPCDVGRGVDFRSQHKSLKNALERSRHQGDIKLQAEFDVTDVNLFAKLNTFRPHIVHLSGNQNGGDVLLPASDGGEVVVPDIALAGLLSSLGSQVRLVVVDTCMSYKCAKRVSEVVDFTLGVEDDIYDDDATRFYEVFYQALAAGQSLENCHRQAVAALQFAKVPAPQIPRLCAKSGHDPSKAFLLASAEPRT